MLVASVAGSIAPLLSLLRFRLAGGGEPILELEDAFDARCGDSLLSQLDGS